MIATSKPTRFTVAEYFRMSDAGVFDDRRVELIDGRILQMHAQANPHRAAVTKVSIILNRHFSDTTEFWPVFQGTCVLEPHDAPEPDFHILNVPVGTPDKNLPKPFLVIEVADTSYKRDAGIKLRKYGSAGIQDYWIVNNPDKRVEVHRQPENPTGKKRDWRYAQVKHFRSGEKIKLLAYPKISFAVAEMLP